jgi:hypothetical protein
MNVEIGAEAALFPEKEYINGIAVAVRGSIITQTRQTIPPCMHLHTNGLSLNLICFYGTGTGTVASFQGPNGVILCALTISFCQNWPYRV